MLGVAARRALSALHTTDTRVRECHAEREAYNHELDTVVASVSLRMLARVFSNQALRRRHANYAF